MRIADTASGAIGLLRGAPFTSGAARQVEASPAARKRSTLARVDYEDAFLVEVDPARDRTPEQWVRTMLEDAPIAIRGALLSGWSALGVQLGPAGSKRFVLGWEVRRSTPEFVLLGASSRFGLKAELVLERQRGALLFATLVQQQNPLARLLWAGVEPIHQPVVRYILEQGSRRA
jgi:hypothetical protein